MAPRSREHRERLNQGPEVEQSKTLSAQQQTSLMSAPMWSAVRGVCSAGLMTTVFPQLRAGAIFHMNISRGKFHCRRQKNTRPRQRSNAASDSPENSACGEEAHRQQAPVPLHQVGQLVQQSPAAGRVHPPPRRAPLLGRLGSLHRFVHIFLHRNKQEHTFLVLALAPYVYSIWAHNTSSLRADRCRGVWPSSSRPRLVSAPRCRNMRQYEWLPLMTAYRNRKPF
ncbi:hypothetical protein EYF80_014360 [Liparis tanakae]|uniref:Uncharacterized protein n=1 Tax=Liparis tanakae TaxID=230148 RepID=A0A4Z2IE81_9TELE|nr:hypothetical protein EYF80_014360 [Liparis tanakae]